MRKKSWRGWLILLVLLIVPGLALSQAVQQSRTLIVNGKSGQVKVMEIDGRSYVDLESLARIGNGTLAFSGNQIRRPHSVRGRTVKPACQYRILERVLGGQHRRNGRDPGMAKRAGQLPREQFPDP
jgi:hypothetical protein